MNLTVLEVVKKTAEFFAGKGIESPRLNAELLVGHALGLPRMQLYLQFERPLADADLEKIRPLVRRRAQREPLQYIVGHVDFSGLKLKVDRRALIPRPETEYLIEIIAARYGESPPAKILDMGTGTGAIALALAKTWPNSAITAVDASADALNLARENSKETSPEGRIAFIRSDWFEAIGPADRFDLIISNPPYLSSSELAAAAPEVRDHEPTLALVARDNGVADLRSIIQGAPSHLAPGGMIALETGPEQHGIIRQIAGECGFVDAESILDLAKRDRYILARQI